MRYLRFGPIPGSGAAALAYLLAAAAPAAHAGEHSIPALVDGYAADLDGNGTFDTLDTASETVLTRDLPPLEERGLIEFALPELDPSAQVTAATLTLNVLLLQYPGGDPGVAVDFLGYAGDGVLTLADATSTDAVVGRLETETLGEATVALDPAFVQSLLRTGQHLGLVSRLTGGQATSFASLEFPFADPPTLNLEFVHVLRVDADAAAGTGDGLSWENAFVSLQDALAQANLLTDVELWIAYAGGQPYRPDQGSTVTVGDRSASFVLRRNVALLGGFQGTAHPSGGEVIRSERDPTAYVTILSGDLAGDDGPGLTNIEENSVHVLTAMGVDATPLLDGLTITAGNANLNPNNGQFGGGLFSSNASPTLVGCVFEANSAIYGGAIFKNGYGIVRAVGCTFVANHAYQGGAVHIRDYDVQRFINSVFSGNAATESGGAIFVGSSRLRVQQCSFHANRADQGSAIHVGTFHYADLSNCILAAARDGRAFRPQVSAGSPDRVMVRSCDIQGSGGSADWNPAFGVDLGGNIDAIPLFLDPDGPDDIIGTRDDDLRLTVRSPACDAGDNDAVPVDELDLDGDSDVLERIPVDAAALPRFVDAPRADTGQGSAPLVDMGAFEFDNDCDHNGVPDDAEPDADGDGVTDACDVCDGFPDLNDADADGVPDDCDECPGADDSLDVDGNGTIDGCEGPILYVDAAATAGGTGGGWPGAHTTLQTALAVAESSAGGVEEIWVAAGTYYPDEGLRQTLGDRTASFQLVNAVALYGGFLGNADLGGGETQRDERDPAANLTVLSGDLAENDVADRGRFVVCLSRGDAVRLECKSYDTDGDDDVDPADGGMDENSHHVVNGTRVGPTARLDGFLITGGNALDLPAIDGCGGGVYVRAGGPTIHGCTIAGNAAWKGGAICNDRNATTAISGCTVAWNYADEGGGAYNEWSTPAIDASTFVSNRSRVRGGAMANDLFASPTISGCTFEANLSDDGGGIATTDFATSTIADCLFRDNVAGDGAGLFTQEDAASVTGCTFEQNRGSYGGGIWIASADGHVTDCTFRDNTATRGGGIYTLDTVRVSRSTFVRNAADWGGGMLAAGDSLIVDSAFRENTATYGGGLFTNDGTALVRTTFIANLAADGAAIRVDRESEVLISHSRFFGNVATRFGGGVSIYEESVTDVSNSVFSGNEARDGGAIAGEWGADARITASTFSRNQAQVAGGAIYSSQADPTFPVSNATVTVANSVMYDNHAGVGPQLLNDGQYATASIRHCDIQGSGGSGNWDSSLGVDQGGNIDAYPFFVSPAGPDGVAGTEDDDLRIRIPSPAIDAGDNAALVPDRFDLDGDTDTAEPTPVDANGDTRRLDIAGIADTGSGAAPIVDMGAYEYDGDCDDNGIADEKEPDADADGVIDACDLCPAADDFVNSDNDAAPDACDACEGFDDLDDADSDGRVDGCEDPRMYVQAGAAAGTADGSSWLNAYPDLQTALAVARNRGPAGSEIWVAAATYRPDRGPLQTAGDRTAIFQLADHTRVYGGFLGSAHPAGGETSRDERDPAAHETILSGDLAVDDEPGFVNVGENSLHVVFASGTSATALLDGFTITGGRGDFGGGLYITHDGRATFRDCTFLHNSAARGGAVYAFRAAPTIIDSRFVANHADQDGGAFYNVEGDTRLIGCALIGNTAEDDGGAIHTSAHPSNRLSMWILNSIIYGNQAGDDGGALYNFVTDPTLTHCTVARNRSGPAGGSAAIHNQSGQVRVRNGILWGNYGSVLVNWDTRVASAVFHYTAYDQASAFITAVGVIRTDPLFADIDALAADPTALQGLQLTTGSPCIDAADNGAVPPDEHDLDADGDTAEPTPLDLTGGPRFANDPQTPDSGLGNAPIADMGAFEFANACSKFDVPALTTRHLTALVDCLTGPDQPAAGLCLCTDLDRDGAVDTRDYASFQLQYAAP